MSKNTQHTTRVLLFFGMFTTILLITIFGFIRIAKSANPVQEFSAKTNIGSSLNWGTPTLIDSIGDAPQLAINANDEIYISWRRYQDYIGTTYLRKSLDGGSTFGPEVLAANNTNWGHSMLADENGNVYAIFSNQSVSMTRSINYGTSFDYEIQVDDGTGISYNDHPDMAQDNSGNLYAVWSYYITECCPYPQGIYFAKSTDGGTSFEPIVHVDDMVNSGGSMVAWYPSIAVTPNGTIYVVWADFRDGTAKSNIFFTRSTDGGLSFEENRQINDVLLSSPYAASLDLASFGNDRVYIVWTDERNGNKDIYFAKSTDAGISFQSDLLINDDDGIRDQEFPSIAVSLNGQILISWFDQRNTSDFSHGDIFTTVSDDGGETFEMNVPVNEEVGTVCCGGANSKVAYDSSNKPHIIWSQGQGSLYFASGEGGSSGSPTPFLDLPIDYSTTTFAKAVQGNKNGTGMNGCVNSWFDHEYPSYDLPPNNTAPGMRRWDGSYFPNANGIGLGWYDGHAGIDFCRQVSTNAIAAADGNVISVTSNCVEGDRLCGGKLGNNVWIDHENGYVTIYGHLVQGNGIPLGRISKGDSVGQIGNTGHSFGAHLHFEVRYDADENGQWSFSETVDPYGWNPLSDPNQTDPWSVTSHYLWQYPLNKQVTMDNTGGTISSVSGATNVSVPSGALTSLLTLDLWEAPPVAGASAQLRSVGFSPWLRVLEWLSGSNNVMATPAVNEFEQPVTLTIDYSEADMTHLDESQLAIHRWDSVNNEWQMLSTSVNTAQKTATVQTIQTGNFDLQAPLLCSADVREPDDNYYVATAAIADGTLWNQRFGVSQDEDWFKFEAVAGEMYLVETSNLATGVDTRLEIYDQDGLVPLSSDDNSGTGMGSYLQWVAPRDGIYFVRIAQANGSSYGCDAAYDFSLTSSHKIYLPSILNIP